MYDDDSATWVNPSTITIEVGHTVQHYFGDITATIVDLPGDGTIELKPKRGSNFSMQLSVFRNQYLVRLPSVPLPEVV
jgi:hypothetical protein